MTLEVVSGDAAIADIAGEACNLLLYGPPGIGKTTDAVSAWVKDSRCRAFFCTGEPGALKPILARGIPMPDHPKGVITTYEAFVEACLHAGKNRHLYDAIILDGFSAWNASLVQAFENKSYNNKYKMWNDIRQCLFNIRDGCRQLGIHVVYIAHEANPWFDEQKNFHKGGPLMTPKTAIPVFAGGVDTILRVSHVGAQRVYYTGGEEWPNALGMMPPDIRNWYAKNREGCNQAVVPADLGNFLRARRPPYLGV